jgi:caffeoyl-CoA O-methyltransferase
MEFLDPELDQYAEKHSSAEPSVLKELNRETQLKVLMPRMLAGAFQGRFLSFLSHMIKPQTVLEIGTYTGYSAICFAEGLAANGIIHTIDINPELESMQLKYFEKAGIKNKVKNYVGNALEIIPAIKGNFDLVFIDADKENYLNYYNMLIDRLNPGAYIVADNVLWSGKVLNTVKHNDEETLALDEFNRIVSADTRVENILLPIRDGLMLCRKT